MVFFSVLLILKENGEVKGGIVEKGAYLVFDQQYRLYEGQHVVLEVGFYKFLLFFIQVEAPKHVDFVVFQLGDDLFLKYAAEFLLLFVDDPLNILHDLFGVDVQLLFRLFAYPQQVAVVGHPDPEKFIQVGRINGQEFKALKQWYGRVFSLLQNPVIEG